jgi:hypothetical protein
MSLDLSFLPGIAGIISGAIGFYFGVADGNRRWRRRLESLKSLISAAILHSQPSWSTVKEVASLSGMSQSEALLCVRELLRDVVVGDAGTLEPHRSLLDGYIEAHSREQPFEGVPPATRLQFERLKEVLGEQEHLLDPLTSQVRELVSIYEKDKRRQRRYTAGGFFLAVVSLAFAAYTYYAQKFN